MASLASGRPERFRLWARKGEHVHEQLFIPAVVEEQTLKSSAAEAEHRIFFFLFCVAVVICPADTSGRSLREAWKRSHDPDAVQQLR